MSKDEMEMIEEIYSVLCMVDEHCGSTSCRGCKYFGNKNCIEEKSATLLYNAGYRKVAEDEIVESMKTYERARQETARENADGFYCT